MAAVARPPAALYPAAMSSEPETARAAAERSAQALMTGNLSQLMLDLTPEALGQLMTAGAAIPGAGLGQMPSIGGYEIADAGGGGDGELFHVTFSANGGGKATLAVRWKQVLGQWKIVELGVVGVEPAEGASPPPPAE